MRVKVNEFRVTELISVLGSQPAGDRSHKPGGRLPFSSAKPAVTSPAANEGNRKKFHSSGNIADLPSYLECKS